MKHTMKTNTTVRLTKWLACLTALAALAGSNTLQAQVWQTVLDYQLAAGKVAGGSAIAADAFGNVFSGGIGDDPSGTPHGLVLKTDTAQANWYLSDDTNPSATQYQSYLWNLGLDASANAYSIGQLTPNSTGIASWYVRKSSDSGLTWSTVDLYQYAAGKSIDATGFAADNSGNIYVAGWGRDATKNSYLHWLVRKSSDGGQTWTLVDDLQGPTGNFGAAGAGYVSGAGVFVAGPPYASSSSSWLVRRSLNGASGTWSTVDNPFAGAARAVGSDTQGNVYVAGTQVTTVTIKTHPLTTASYSAWVTRKSSDGGNTWSTVDTFTYAQNAASDAYGIGKDAAGNVVVVGRAYDGQNKAHWIVRTLGSSGWQTSDDFQIAPGYYAVATGVATDAAGNLLATGNANDSTGTHWIVRRLANSIP